MLTLPLAFALLGALFELKPFDAAGNVLDRAFGAAPDWTQVPVQSLYHDERRQMTEDETAALSAYDALANYWSQAGTSRRFMFIGNSQMMRVSLAAAEGPSVGNEKTFVDRLSTKWSPPARSAAIYRLSNVGISYPEALWHLNYLLTRPELKPNVLVVQCNYQIFSQAGIRKGLYSMLLDSRFRQRIESVRNDREPYADLFDEALRDFSNGAIAHRSDPVFKAPFAPGEAFETVARAEIDRFGTFRERHEQLESLEGLLYRFRVYVLRLKPSTGRSIGGTRQHQARAALCRIATLCRENGIELVLYYAPVNPDVSVYATQADRKDYREWVANLAWRQGSKLCDFETSVPNSEWGRSYNAPDPLHLGRRGHARMADLMQSCIKDLLPGE